MVRKLSEFYENLPKKMKGKDWGEVDPIYQKVAEGLNAKGHKLMPIILAKLITPEQARIVLELPAPPEEIAEKLKMDKELVDKHLEEMKDKGLIVITKRGARMVRNPLQLHDAATTNRKYDKELGDEYFDLWAAYQLEEHYPDLLEVIAGGENPYSRLIPRYNAIKDLPGVLPFENLKEIFKNQEIIALVPCPCKRCFRERDCGIDIEDTCINVGRTAQYNLSRGIGKEITSDEVMKFFDATDKLPLVHVASNQRDVNVLLCNCHWDCCELILPLYRSDKYKVEQGLTKSRFEATVDPEKCKACGKCVEICQFDAAKMKHYPELGETRAYIDVEKCMGCGSCVVNCVNEARGMKIVRPPEHVPEEGPPPY